MVNIAEPTYIEEILVKSKSVTPNQLKMAKATLSLNKSIGIIDAISQLGFSSELDMLSVVAREMGFKEDATVFSVPKSDLKDVMSFYINLSEAASKARQQCLISVNEVDKSLEIVTSDPLGTVEKRETEAFYKSHGYTAKFFVTTKLILTLVQKRVYSESGKHEEEILRIIQNKDDAGEGINHLISVIFEYATLERASDIYFNLNKNETELSYVFFRIDRKKQFMFALPFGNAIRISQAIKQQSGMEAGKLRGHQDGAMEVKILDDRYQLSIRVNSISTVSGEQITMRIQMEDRMTLTELGFLPAHIKKIQDTVLGLKGIIILTGVTGSGKTTTLYSMLSLLDPDAYNILTMEDPVEIRVKGINQVQINEHAGQSFTDTIRAALRQAPDVILLGEIRDAETAFRAVEMSLTGHLVLTTLHTDSVSAIPERLRDLGISNVDAFMRATSVAVHQELVAKEGGGLKLAYEVTFDGLKTVERKR